MVWDWPLGWPTLLKGSISKAELPSCPFKVAFVLLIEAEDSDKASAQSMLPTDNSGIKHVMKACCLLNICTLGKDTHHTCQGRVQESRPMGVSTSVDHQASARKPVIYAIRPKFRVCYHLATALYTSVEYLTVWCTGLREVWMAGLILRSYGFFQRSECPPMRCLRKGASQRIPSRLISPRQAMTSSKTTHVERTAADQREAGIHAVTITNVEQRYANVRLLRFRPLTTKDSRPIKARGLIYHGLSSQKLISPM